MTIITPSTTDPATATPSGALGVHQLLSERWSTRAFDPEHVLEPAVSDRLLEAARWSPSASNTQPWRFVLAERGTTEHEALFAALMGFNQAWAGAASALVLFASERTRYEGAEGAEGKALRWADLDAGQALAHLTVQAAAEGLVVHAMGGFDVDAVRESFEVPEGVEPVVVLAVGRQGDLSLLDDAVRVRETTRARRPLAELLLPLRPQG